MNTQTIDTQKRLATEKQKALLQTLGYSGNPEELTLEAASSEIERLLEVAKERVEAAKEWIKHNVKMAELAGRYTTLRRESGKSVAGPCPKCGGDDRFYIRAERFHCRQCHIEGGDAIEFVQWKEGLSYIESILHFSGGSLPTVTGSPVTPRRAKAARETLSDTKAQAIAKSARAALLDSPEGQAGRDYLTGRGLWPETWELFGLGYCPAPLPGTWKAETKTRTAPKQPAICLPWQMGNGKIPAIRYRFLSAQTYTDIDGKERTEKQTAQFASDFAGRLFGGCALSGPGNVQALVLCEGEINAMSVWQATAGAVDVLSLGSESAHLTEAAIRAILRYQRVIVWMDRAENAKGCMVALPGAVGFKSPHDKDANDWLQAGVLPEILQRLIENGGRG